jgi:hypothetical protein
MKLPRRQFLHLAAGAFAVPAMSRNALAQAYPSRQRTSLAAARMKHMRDRDVQKDRLAKAGGNIGFGWIWEYDPVASWDKLPVVPAIE